METTREQNVRIATEGLRLMLECKVPQFSSSTGFDHMQEQKEDWSKLLPHTLPPLLDWIEQHRYPLLEENNRDCAAVQEFQQRFLLVFLEQDSEFITDDASVLKKRLSKFCDDVERILTTNTAIRSWLFHYYGSELGLQGWKWRPGDLYSLSQLLNFLERHHHKVDVLFGQRMTSFMENIGKELLGFKQYLEYQKIGILIMTAVMQINYKKGNNTSDAGKILAMDLQVDRWAVDEHEYDRWSIIYYSVASICNAKNAKTPKDDEIMLYLLAYLNEELIKREDNPNDPVGHQSLSYLRAVTLLLLLEVPGIDMDDSFFDEITISGRKCDQDAFRQHVKSQLRTTADLRFSLNIRLRIAKMIPKLFAGFASKIGFDFHAYRCLELLTWMVMFPLSQTRQQNNARGIMLRRLLDEMKLWCESFIRNRSEYMRQYDGYDLSYFYDYLQCLVTVVREGLKLLPNAGWFEMYKSNMQTRMTEILFMLEVVKSFEIYIL